MMIQEKYQHEVIQYTHILTVWFTSPVLDCKSNNIYFLCVNVHKLMDLTAQTVQNARFIALQRDVITQVI